jgi:hypothetical protein
MVKEHAMVHGCLEAAKGQQMNGIGNAKRGASVRGRQIHRRHRKTDRNGCL